NVGSFFRTADAAGIERLYLGGITAAPPHRGISKTALGAENRVEWDRIEQAPALLQQRRAAGVEIAAIETSLPAIDLVDWKPGFPVCIVFGNEYDGSAADVADLCETHTRHPMLGMTSAPTVAAPSGLGIHD